MTKFTSNRILLIITSVLFLSSWYLLLNFYNPSYNLIYFVINIIGLHYLFTIVHQSSHNLLAKDTRLNHIFGFLACILTGITFADFQYTHTMHHKHIGNPQEDPDHKISGSGPILLIPFKIFYHDYYFWLNCESRFMKFSYLLQRGLQITIIMVLFLDKSWMFINFWLIPMGIIGIANALFLFYFPHYKHPIETTFLNVGPIKSSIEISRTYHHKHHDDPSNNLNFFPFEDTFIASLTNNHLVYTAQKDYFYTKSK